MPVKNIKLSENTKPTKAEIIKQHNTIIELLATANAERSALVELIDQCAGEAKDAREMLFRHEAMLTASRKHIRSLRTILHISWVIWMVTVGLIAVRIYFKVG